MAGITNFPTALDTNSELFEVTDVVSSLQAAHHNNMAAAIKAIEAKVGIDNTGVPTALDYRLGHPTNSHRHDGATGQGMTIHATTIEGLASYIGVATSSVVDRFVQTIQHRGTSVVGSNVAPPVALGRTMSIENVSGVLRRGPSGATAAYKILVGPTPIFGASVGLGIRFAPGATRYGQPSPNLGTYPSGAIISLDVEAVGSSAPGEDLSVVLVFRG